MSIPLVFVHGWGLNSTMWDPMISALATHDCHTIDLGFIAGGKTNWQEWSEPAIYIGHSLGSLWVLKFLQEKPLNLTGFVAIAGFSDFTQCADQKTLQLMQRGIEKKPVAQLSHFWRQAGVPGKPEADKLNQSRLLEGLNWLAKWQLSSNGPNLTCSKCILASKKDKIVPSQVTETQWQPDQIIWHETAPHTLPMIEPHWCAKNLQEFLQRF